jgi:starch synthase (maltosyl-transferring)
MRAGAARPFLVRLEPDMPLEAERPAAGFANWYEIFPRSQSGDCARHGTFADVIARLPAIRAMGFDVLYFPPIHPIGRIHRKGRNNALTALPEDPGSPYAIGSDEGGHDAIHPALGTLEDFRRLCAAASEQMHGAVVGDVVTVVAPRRGIEGQKPDRGRPQLGDIVELRGQAGQVADVGLRIAALTTGYGQMEILHAISLETRPGEMVSF